MANYPSHLDVYINYPGTCEEAFRFYEEHLGGTIKLMTPHQQALHNFPAEWKRPILHAVLELNGMLVRGADIPDAQPMRSAYLTLRFDNAAAAEHVYNLFADEGTIFMKMEKTPFANRFAMLRDKFGTSWMILHE